MKPTVAGMHGKRLVDEFILQPAIGWVTAALLNAGEVAVDPQ